MKLTRRNALIGMGTVAAGAGVIGGTGAFTSVQADRTVSVQTTADSSAALQLIPAESDGSTTPNAADYVDNGDDGDDTITINLNSTDEGASGLNQNARTVLENLVSVLNNGTQAVTSLTLELTSDSDAITDNDTFAFTASDDSTDIPNDSKDEIPNNSDILSSSYLDTDIGVGSGSVDFGLIVDLIDGGTSNNDLPDSASYTLTITAETS